MGRRGGKGWGGGEERDKEGKKEVGRRGGKGWRGGEERDGEERDGEKRDGSREERGGEEGRKNARGRRDPLIPSVGE